MATKRSPNYPGVDLAFAVGRAQRLWTEQQHHAVHRTAAMKNLGYAEKSGAGTVTYGALKRFGLLEDTDHGKVRLSDLGVGIVRGELSEQRDLEKIRRAALLPRVHRAV